METRQENRFQTNLTRITKLGNVSAFVTSDWIRTWNFKLSGI